MSKQPRKAESLKSNPDAAATAPLFQAFLARLQQHPQARQLDAARLQSLGRLLSGLKEVGDCGEEWRACCPAHPDSRPSLSIDVGDDGKFLLYCHAGCSFNEIIKAIEFPYEELFRSSPAPRSAPPPPKASKLNSISPTPSKVDWKELQAELAGNITPAEVTRLGKKLGVMASSLRQLEVGITRDRSAYTFPERNGNLEITGIVCRRLDGTKVAMKDSRRSLTVPANWSHLTGEVYICEGQTDVAAALSHQVRAVGRPGINSGLNDLAILLRSVPDEIILVADNDPHDPTKEKVRQLGFKLENVLNRKIRIQCPASPFKDLREFLAARNKQWSKI